MPFIVLLAMFIISLWLFSLKFSEQIGNVFIKCVVRPIKNIFKGDK